MGLSGVNGLDSRRGYGFTYRQTDPPSNPQQGATWDHLDSNGLTIEVVQWNGTQWVDFDPNGNALATPTFDLWSQRPTGLTTLDAGKVWLYSQTGAIHKWTGTGWLVQNQNDVVNVKDYGALGNNVADDTLAIQTAINLGKDVYFPPGVYRITGVVLRPNCAYYGCGAASTIELIQTTTGTIHKTAFLVEGVSNVKIHNLTFTCTTANNLLNTPVTTTDTFGVTTTVQTPNRPVLIRVSGLVQACYIHTVVIKQTVQSGIVVGGTSDTARCTDIVIDNVKCVDWYPTTGSFPQIWFREFTHKAIVQNCYVTGGDMGIAFFETYASNTEVGASMYDCSALNNIVDTQAQYGIFSYRTRSETFPNEVYNTKIIGNRVSNILGSVGQPGDANAKGFGMGIYCVGEGNVLIKDNYVYDTLQQTTFQSLPTGAIGIAGTKGSIVVTNNLIDKSGWGGIFVINNPNGKVVISANTIKGCVRESILLNIVNNATVSDNVISEGATKIRDMVSVTTCDTLNISANNMILTDKLGSTTVGGVYINDCTQVLFNDNYVSADSNAIVLRCTNNQDCLVASNTFNNAETNQALVWFSNAPGTRVIGNIYKSPWAVKVLLSGDLTNFFADLTNKLTPTQVSNSATGSPYVEYLGALKFDNWNQRPTTLTAADAGLTYIYTQTGNAHRWDGTQWVVLNGSVLNAKDYGCIGNGVNDDSTNLNAFFVLAGTKNWDRVVLDGTFAVSQAIVFNGTFTNANPTSFARNWYCNATIQATQPTINTLLTLFNCQNLNIDGSLTLSGLGDANLNTRQNEIGLKIVNCNQLKFTDLRLFNFKQMGVVLESGINDLIDLGNVVAQSCGPSPFAANQVTAVLSNKVSTGTAGNINQRTTLDVTALPPADSRAYPAFAVIDNYPYLITDYDTLNNRISIYPWIDGSSTSSTVTYIYGGAVVLQGTNATLTNLNSLNCNNSAIGLVSAASRGPTVRRLQAQSCHMAVCFGGGLTALHTSTSIQNLSVSSNTFDLIRLTNWSGLDSNVISDGSLALTKSWAVCEPRYADNRLSTHVGFNGLNIYSGSDFLTTTAFKAGGNQTEELSELVLRPGVRHSIYKANARSVRLGAIDLNINRLYGHDDALVTFVGTGAGGAPTGSISFVRPDGWTLNGSNSPLVFSGFTKPATFAAIYRTTALDVEVYLM